MQLVLQRCMGLKYFLFVVVFAGLLAAIIAAVVVFRDRDDQPSKLIFHKNICLCPI